MIRRVTDLVRRAKVSGHSVVGKSWKIFKVPKRAACQDYLFPMYRERDTAPLRWQKISKFFHRLLRFDSPVLCLTKTSWVESEWPSGLFPKSPADRYLIDESVCESALSCDECKPVSGRLLTRGWFDSLSRFEWTRKTVDGTWNLKKKFFEKISKYKASALEDYAFT